MDIQLGNSLVRLFSSDDKVLGAGFLVGEKMLLTCAHVIAAALDLKIYPTDVPAAEVSLDFPLIDEQKFTAQVVFWQPPQANGRGDIAVLRLNSDPPPTAKAARLIVADDLWGHDFRVFGFPEYHNNGVWASGKLRAPEATGWVLIEDVKETGYQVLPGFSGGAVWDEQLDGVVGMVVAADENPTIKAAYIIPSKVLIETYPELRQQAIPPCPYRGLFAFREQDEPYFFGREEFTKHMVAAVNRDPLLAVVGPSGSGKSSVVFGGMIPYLRRGRDWLISSLRPGNRPFHALTTGLISLFGLHTNEIDILTEVEKLSQRLLQGDFTIRDVVELALNKNPDSRILLVIDQFEELYTLCQDINIRQNFLDGLLEAVHSVSRTELTGVPRFTLVLTLRTDFIGQALSYRPFADALQYADLKLGPMNLRELNAVIKGPANKLHVRVEKGLTERILNELHEPNHLPLLEFALTLLWAKQQDHQLTHAAYEEIGRVEQALVEHAEAVYRQINKNDQQRVQRILLQLVRPGEGTEDTRRIATRTEVGEENWNMSTRLASTRLVVSGYDDVTGEETLEIVHEALIQRWVRLQSWINADRAFLAWYQGFRSTLHLWQDNKQDEGLLLRGAPLIEAKSWLEKRDYELNTKEREYLFHSILYENTEVQKLLPRFWKNEEIFSFIDIYRDDKDDIKRLKCIEALRWSSYSAEDKDILSQLQQFMLNDVSPTIRNKAAQSLCERGHISYLTKLLGSAGLTKQQNRWLIQSLAYIRNLPNLGFELNKSLKYFKSRVRFTAMLKILSDYRNHFAIIAFFSYILGQTSLLLILQVGGEMNNFIPEQIQLSSDVSFLSYNVFHSVVILLIGTYILIRTLLIDRKDISLKKCIFSSLLYVFFIDSLGYLIIFIGLYIQYKNFNLPFSNYFYDYIFYTGIVRDIILVSTISLTIYFIRRKKVTYWNLFFISFFASLVTIFVGYWLIPLLDYLLSNQTEVFSRDGMYAKLDVLLYIGNTYWPSSFIGTWITSTFIEFVCLLGFRFGFHSAFMKKNQHPQTTISRDNSLVDLIDISTKELQSTEISPVFISSRKKIQIIPGGLLPHIEYSQPMQESNIAPKSSWFTRNLLRIILISIVALIISFSIVLQRSLPRPLNTYHLQTTNISTVIWSPDGTRLASEGDNRNTVEVWDTVTAKTLYTYQGHLSAANASISNLSWSPDGSHLAASYSVGNNNDIVEVWNAATGKNLYIYQGHLSAHANASISNLSWSPDGSLLAASYSIGNNTIASSGATVEVWNAATGKNLYIYQGHLSAANASISNLSWSPDGSHLAASYSESNSSDTIEVWNAATGKNLYILKYGVASNSSSDNETLVWSPDGLRLAAGSSSNNLVEVWNAVTGKTLFDYRTKFNNIPGVVWSPDSMQLAIFNYNSGFITYEQQVQAFKKQSFSNQSIQVNNDQTANPNVIDPSANNFIVVWNAATGKTLSFYHEYVGGVSSVVWSPDDKDIVSIDIDGIVEVWEASSGDNIYGYNNYNQVVSANFINAGEYFMSIENDGTVSISKIP